MRDDIIHRIIDGEHLSDDTLSQPPERLEALRDEILNARQALESAAIHIDVTLTPQPA